MRNRFDQFAKLVTREAYAPGGEVVIDAEVSPDAKRIDVWFTPNPALAPATLAPLGLLGRIARAACTIEPFHEPPDGDEALDCICKHHLFRRSLAQRSPAPPLPAQWILSAGRPTAALGGLCFRRSRRWGAGVYEGPPLTHTSLIVIRELPEMRDTLLVRLMGAGRTLRRAILELKSLPEDAPERRLALPVLLRLRLEVLATPARRTKDDEEFVMSTDDIVEKYLEECREQGRQQGVQQSLLSVYKARFGEPPRGISTAIQRMHDPAVLQAWLDLIATRPADEIAAALHPTRPGRASRSRTSASKSPSGRTSHRRATAKKA